MDIDYFCVVLKRATSIFKKIVGVIHFWWHRANKSQELVSHLLFDCFAMSVLTHPKIADSIAELIGRTPLLRLGKLNKPGNAEILLKLESMEPCSSVKVSINSTYLGWVQF